MQSQSEAMQFQLEFLKMNLQVVARSGFFHAQATSLEPLAPFAHAVDTHLQTSLRPMPVPWERDVSAQHRRSGISFAFSALHIITLQSPSKKVNPLPVIKNRRLG